MTDEEIERIAKEVLTDHDLDKKLPVDPFLIASEEEICVLPGEYDNCFDGRLEYRRKNGIGQFYLFYAREELPFRPEGRVRFSVAHELAHFYLPEHRRYLLSGQWHSSHSDYVSKKQRETEADRFAARLLMPTDLFTQKVRRKSGFLTLKELCLLASKVFRTSLTSTVLRYVDLNFESCCMVMAEHGVVTMNVSSNDMRRQALGWIPKGSKIPATSITGKAIISKLSGTQLTSEGSVDSSIWFERRNSCAMWEETMLLTSFGRTLTFLAPEHQSNSYD